MATEHHYKSELIWQSKGETVKDYASYSREYTFSVEGKGTWKGSADPSYKGDPALLNPEEMFLISLSACHMLTYLALCASKKLELISYQDHPEAVMKIEDRKMRITDVILHPTIKFAPGTDLELAAKLHHDAHEGCFVANSVSCRMETIPDIS